VSSADTTQEGGEVTALVLAGGRGQRLQPFTVNFPKPLMPVGDRTVLEIILERLRDHGIGRVTLAVNHLAPLIRAYFAEAPHLSHMLEYIYEEQPLGTAGPIARLGSVPGTVVVMNGDVLTDFDFRKFIAQHRRSGAALSVATMLQSFELESGVVETNENGRVIGFREKPVMHHRICIGIYAVEARARAQVVLNPRLDMPELIMRLVEMGENVAVYDHDGSWIDVGRPDDLARAQQLFELTKDDPR
jgi:NDP-sugar pyrophosphorylase family protein